MDSSVSLTHNQIINQINIFFSVCTSWSAATCESIDCTSVSKLYQQPVNANFCPLFVWKSIH